MRIYLGTQKKYACAVSVIIPMYNAEEFIGECLDSLLIQTLQDFEVIVVDDCSTDKSTKIVESYAEKFGGRLKLTKTEKNLSGAGIARNIGIKLARGEFIQFLDADDFLLGSALETLYNAAIRHTADVVYTSSYYRLDAPNEIFVYRDGFSKSLLKKNQEVKTFFKLDKPQENLNRLLLIPGEGEFHSSWTKFFRRDFLLKNKIFFPTLPHSEDFLFVVNVYCHAKRFLHIPTPLYFYRNNNDSTTQKMRPPEEQLLYWTAPFVDFIKILYDLECENEVLEKNPLYCLAVLKNNLNWRLNRTAEPRKTLAEEDIYKILYATFAKNFSDSSAMLLPFFFTAIGMERKLNLYQSGIIKKIKQYFTARLDVKLIPEGEGDFKKISVSDDKAAVRTPAWFQKGGIGYVVESYAGNVEVVFKATGSGKLTLNLRGIPVNNADKSARVPYWIDYTKLIVNEQIIFDTLTPVWHDKPYFYSINVKADDEIKIQAEWLPHRSDV